MAIALLVFANKKRKKIGGGVKSFYFVQILWFYSVGSHCKYCDMPLCDAVSRHLCIAIIDALVHRYTPDILNYIIIYILDAQFSKLWLEHVKAWGVDVSI